MTCPVSTPTKPLPFKLDDLNLIDVARDHVKRDWISTFESLGSSPALRNLHELRLDAFPTAAEHLLRLVPCASSLRELHLSVLRPSPHAWQTYVFAAACTSLVELHVNYILGWGAEVLSCFPSGPPLVVVGSISGAVGHGHPHVRQQGLETCPIRVLIDTLWRREPGKLKRLLVQRMRYTTHDYGGDLAQLEAMRGVKSIVGTETSMTDDEVRRRSASRLWSGLGTFLADPHSPACPLETSTAAPSSPPRRAQPARRGLEGAASYQAARGDRVSGGGAERVR